MGRRKKTQRMVGLTVYLPPNEARMIQDYSVKEDLDISYVLRSQLQFGPLFNEKILPELATKQHKG